jgi:UDP-N-acetylmuramate dehydrogenase
MAIDLTTLRSSFPTLIFKENESLAPYTHMKVGGPARMFVEVDERQNFFSLVSYCYTHTVPFIIFGGASNVIVPDEGIDKLVIRNMTREITVFPSDSDVVIVKSDSGVITAMLANKTMEQNLSGLEYFIGVPGTVGGAIFNNSHFTAKELIGNLVKHVEVCTPQGELEVWNVDRLQFDYDYSVFHKEPGVVISATFELHKDTPEAIKERVLKAAQKRASTQPIGEPSSGCMYRNPQMTAEEFEFIRSQGEIPQGAYHQREDGKVQVAAGFLIDSAGLKGASVGGVKVSEKHATYMINMGTGTSHDVEALCQKVEQTIQEKFHVKLEREVFFLK